MRHQDPLHRSIVRGLEELPSDQGERFQACVSDLLGELHPGLVLVSGGPDDGTDGDVPAADGEPIPLIATIAKDPVRNLKQSLAARKKRGLRSDRAVFATSRSLTPNRRHKLYEIARDAGCTLVQIYDQNAVATLLYRDPRWRRELLGIAGDLQALSVLPPTSRPFLELPPIGRESDLETLRKAEGDIVLVGQPGSGKSFLLHHLAREGWGLFVATDSIPTVVDAWREKAPPRILLDDAHFRLDLLEAILRARQEIGSGASIVATTWPGGEAAVSTRLEGARRHSLELLTRDEIVAIYEELGIEATRYMGWLVTQAANKPGLAVMIANLLLHGQWHALATGEALHQSTTIMVARLLGEDATAMLGILAAGGAVGYSLATTAELLGWSNERAWRIATQLAAGGVISQTRANCLAVNPPVLRDALVRRLFFSDVRFPIPFREVLERAPSPASAVTSLVGAIHAGAAVPPEDVRQHLRAHGTGEAFNAYAALGREAARWAVEQWTGPLSDLAPTILRRAPEAILPRLLSAAEQEPGSPHSSPRHPLRLVADWVEDLDEALAHGVERRRLLTAAIEEHVSRGGCRGVAARAGVVALSPAARGSHLDPGRGDTVTLESAILPVAQLQQITELWPRMRSLYERPDAERWSALHQLYWSWRHMRTALGASASEDQARVGLDFAREIVQELWQAEDRPGVKCGLARLAAKAGIELEAGDEGFFALLFPELSRRDLERGAESRAWITEVRRLAKEWANRPPQEILGLLTRLEEEAATINHNYPRRTPALAREIASRVDDPAAWGVAFVDAGLPGDLLVPFLEAALDRSPEPAWRPLLERCLQASLWPAAEVLLGRPRLPSDLERELLRRAPEIVQLVETAALRGEVPLERLTVLFDHEDARVAIAAAIGHWLADPHGEVDPRIEAAWSRAVLRAPDPGPIPDVVAGFEHSLGDILASRPELSLRWLRGHLRSPEALPWSFGEETVTARALGSLDLEQRLIIAEELPADHPAVGQFLPHLVAGEPTVLSRILERKDLSDMHLEALAGKPDEAWALLATTALQHGMSPDQVAGAIVQLPSGSSWGSLTQHWRDLRDAFAQLPALDRRLEHVAAVGIELAEERIARAEASKRSLALHGHR